MTQRRTVVGEVGIARRSAKRAPPSRACGQANRLDGLSESCRLACPSFDKGTEAFCEDFTGAGNGITAKFTDMQEQLDTPTGDGQISHQARIVTADVPGELATQRARLHWGSRHDMNGHQIGGFSNFG